jgi:hypothetical protein
MADVVEAGVDAGADAGAEVAPGPRTVIERPPPGLARGKYAWPAWGIGAAGATVIALAIAYFVWRYLRTRRR